MFKIGDKVTVVNDQYIWLDGYSLPHDTVLTIVDMDDDFSSYVNADELTIEIGAVKDWPEDFVLAHSPSAKFSMDMDGPVNNSEAGVPIPIGEGYAQGGYVGNGVNALTTRVCEAVCNEASNVTMNFRSPHLGAVLTAPSAEDIDHAKWSVKINKDDNGNLFTNGFGVGLGVYRPELNDRKVGKVRVELVDDGFPLALREIAKVMTWAQDAKGYKDHDWQNLPNAEVALAAAASRHRTDHIKQRTVDGFTIEQCVDGESALLHKAHEAFGVLAQLELMLRGEIK